MQSSKVRSFVVAAAVVGASSVAADQGVEWTKAQGGNGHWYRFETSAKTWGDAKAASERVGGHLLTIHSLEEQEFARQGSGSEFWIGLFQDTKAADFSEPAGGWRWVTGEPLTYKRWGSAEPGNQYQSEDYGQVTSGGGPWNDLYNCERSWCVEWDADCNGDGIVDYGQTLSGELADTNGNGVPDCCEDGSVCTPSLIVNSGFESGSPLNACASESVTSGNLVASGWQVSAGVVDRVHGGSACAATTQPKFGDYCIDLCGTPASSGAIKQIVPTVPGHKYRCTFSLSGDASAGPSIKKVHAKVGTYVDLTFTFACTGTGAQAWVSNQFEFTARGANEPLEFVADNGVTTGGPMLDAINLVDITTQCVGDLDASGEVDGADIALLLLNFGPCTTGP